jgi:putative intracellular protease/amidase
MTMMTRRTLVAAGAGAAALPPALAAAAPAAQPARPPEGLRLQGQEQIAMLIYPGMTALDFAGPYHFLGMTGAKVHIVTNQKDLRPVASDLGMAIAPTTTMADAPEDVTVLFAPGGIAGTLAAARDGATIEFLRDRARRASYVTSVCTGSLLLGVAGALRGRRATSHWSVVPQLAQFGAIPQRHRIVRDGNVITAAGVSSGLDFGSALVAELRGRTTAEFEVLMSEYAPEPPIPGGSIETARPEMTHFVSGLLSQFVTEVKTLKVA